MKNCFNGDIFVCISDKFEADMNKSGLIGGSIGTIFELKLSGGVCYVWYENFVCWSIIG